MEVRAQQVTGWLNHYHRWLSLPACPGQQESDSLTLSGGRLARFPKDCVSRRNFQLQLESSSKRRRLRNVFWTDCRTKARAQHSTGDSLDRRQAGAMGYPWNQNQAGKKTRGTEQNHLGPLWREGTVPKQF